MDSMFAWWNGPQKLRRNRQKQPRCSNFERLEASVREARNRRRKETDFVKLQPSYEDLECCARDGCAGCRVIRQGLLLAQITSRQVLKLEKRDDPVYVRLQNNQ